MEDEFRIGGSKGHIEESVTDPLFITLYNAFRWKMIPNCTGRYTCRDHKAVSHLNPSQLLRACGAEEDTIESLLEYSVEFDEEKRKDPILVIPFACDQSTGLISYVKRDGGGHAASFVHTLNSESGFQRKLCALGVVLSDKHRVSNKTN
ncbi:hypothetical protein HJC23_002704 [Cyclotella cryptica]|uniref:Uncharacterized protein n=1 Tax=Cyclotella cryptica TaxID=29204 RepID=A0ABD3PBW9_9STRA